MIERTYLEEQNLIYSASNLLLVIFVTLGKKNY